VKLVDEDSNRYLSTSRTKLRQDIRCNVVVANDMVELETIKLLLELADFQTIGVQVPLVAFPRVIGLVDDHCGIAVD
jgi:hypothetical protein